jgi:hypothetical protein
VEGFERKITVRSQFRQKHKTLLISKAKRARDVAQVVEHLLSNHKTLILNYK